MADLPKMLDGARVLKYAVVEPGVRATGATYRVAVPVASALAVATYDTDPPGSYYLFYLGPDGAVMTDTWHESVEGALSQAAFEYDSLIWTDLSS